MSSPAMRRLAEGGLGTRHYVQVLRQIFHQTRENPQLQVLATVHFRGAERDMVAPFLRHALSEIGHDQLALNDLGACGGNTAHVATENPHPATSALTAFGFQLIHGGNAVAYLGYLFFLEFLPTSEGALLKQALQAVGVPADAFTFLDDHTRVDVGHNRAMREYCARLIHTQDQLDAAIYALRATGYLYSQMVNAAVAQADQPSDWGMAPAERRAQPRLEISDEDLRQRATQPSAS